MDREFHGVMCEELIEVKKVQKSLLHDAKSIDSIVKYMLKDELEFELD